MSTEYGKAKVDTKVMKDTAENSFKAIKKYAESVNRVHDLINNSNTFWEGIGAEAYRGSFSKELKVINTGIEELEKYPRELLEYYNIYSSVIQENRSKLDEIITLELE